MINWTQNTISIKIASWNVAYPRLLVDYKRSFFLSQAGTHYLLSREWDRWNTYTRGSDCRAHSRVLLRDCLKAGCQAKKRPRKKARKSLPWLRDPLNKVKSTNEHYCWLESSGVNFFLCASSSQLRRGVAVLRLAPTSRKKITSCTKGRLTFLIR